VTFEELTRAGYDAWSRRDWEVRLGAAPGRRVVTSGVLPGLDDEYVGRAAEAWTSTGCSATI
jgi:hypothetical protein